jgi:TRAP-type uncharacterized transport system substrate-binding protein
MMAAATTGAGAQTAVTGAATQTTPASGAAQTAPTADAVPATPTGDVTQTAPTRGGAPKMPPGMVRYDHPVVHDGKVILWHGAWRDRLRPKDSGQNAKDQAPAAKTPDPGAAVAAPAKPAPNSFALLADLNDACASRLANDFVAEMHAGGADGRIVAGGVSAAALGAAVNGDSADLAIAPLDALVADPQASAAWRERAPYIAKLSGEPIEIIAARDVADLRQIAGREVGFGVANSADATSAAALFNALGIAPRPAYEPLTDALTDLAEGRLAAVVAVDGRCAPALAQFGADRRFHELAVRWTPAMRAVYAPARLTAKDRPNLIDPAERIDTVAALRALIALDAAPGSSRAQSAAALTKTFFESFDRLLAPDRDDAWRDVNLAAQAPWPRLRAAQQWSEAARPASDASLQSFRAAARDAASADGGPAAQDSDRLYDSLMQWRGAGQ